MTVSGKGDKSDNFHLVMVKPSQYDDDGYPRDARCTGAI
jgi:hypothetical protein